MSTESEIKEEINIKEKISAIKQRNTQKKEKEQVKADVQNVHENVQTKVLEPVHNETGTDNVQDKVIEPVVDEKVETEQDNKLVEDFVAYIQSGGDYKQYIHDNVKDIDQAVNLTEWYVSNVVQKQTTEQVMNYCRARLLGVLG